MLVFARQVPQPSANDSTFQVLESQKCYASLHWDQYHEAGSEEEQVFPKQTLT